MESKIYTFVNGENIPNDEKLKIVKIYKAIKKTLFGLCNRSDEEIEGVQHLIIETVNILPNILKVSDEEGKGLISLMIENKLWSAIFELAKKSEYAQIINQKMLEAQNKNKEIEK